MKLKKYAISMISGLALSGLMVTASIADTVRLKMAGTYPVNHFGHEIVLNMIKEIEDAAYYAEIISENPQEYPYNDPDGVRRIMNSNLGKNK